MTAQCHVWKQTYRGGKKTTPSICKLTNHPFQPNLSRAGAGPPGVWGGPKGAINLQGNHMKPLVPKTCKSVQQFSQKMRSKQFLPLINIILLAKISP